MKTKIAIFTLLLCAAVLTAGNARAQFFYMEDDNVGKPLQEFKLERLGKDAIAVHDYLDGNRGIIFFWATWCPHCREQLKALNAAKQKLEDEKIKVVLVDVGEAEAVVRAFKEKSDIQFDIFLDFEAEMSDAFGVVGVPTFYYVDEKGIVVNTDHSLPDDFNKPFQKSS